MRALLAALFVAALSFVDPSLAAERDAVLVAQAKDAQASPAGIAPTARRDTFGWLAEQVEVQ
jgi:hypothetical protein